MKNRNLILAALMTALAIPILPVIADSTPSGPVANQETAPAVRPDRPRLSPEQREKLRAMTPEERQKFFRERRANCLQAATPEACPQRPMHPRLTPEQRDQVKSMTPEQRQQFFQDMRAKHREMRMGPQGGLRPDAAGTMNVATHG